MRRPFVALVTVALLVLLAPPAAAGGSTLLVQDASPVGAPTDGDGPGWAAPGSTVTLRGIFGDGSQAGIDEGPWFAYLRHGVLAPDDELFVPLGRIEITRADGNYCCWVVSVTFVVPDLPLGVYWVDVCDEGCRTGVGDLIGGGLIVATTALEAELLEKTESLDVLVRDRDRLMVRVRDLRDEAAAERASRLDTDAELRRTVDEVEELGTANDALSAELDATRGELALWKTLAAGLILIVAGMGGWWIWRRRMPRIRVPDTVADLVDEHAGTRSGT